MSHATGSSMAPGTDIRATAFVAARREGGRLATYPGAFPITIDEAYTIQDQAIDLWPDTPAGWKVGRIHGEWEARLGQSRLVGPVFAAQVRDRTDTIIDMPVFVGGFMAVEAECVIIIGQDAPPDKHIWRLEEARELVGAVRLGVEIASSPYARINDDGPLVTISDFGNNAGVILGDALPGSPELQLQDWLLTTSVEGRQAGAATPVVIPGGPLESLRCLAEILAKRGKTLRKGDLVSTGAVTGVHEVRIGHVCEVRADGCAPIHVRLVAGATWHDTL